MQWIYTLERNPESIGASLHLGLKGQFPVLHIR